MGLGLFGLIFASVAMNALAQVALRKAMLVVGRDGAFDGGMMAFGWQMMTNAHLILGMALYGASIVVWLSVLAKAEVGLAYPFQAMGYVIATLVAFLYLGEALSLARFAGIALICSGLVLIARTG